MNRTNAVKDTIANLIANSPRDVFIRKDFQDIGSYVQVGRGLNQLVKKGMLVKIGYGLYAKAIIAPLSKGIIPRKPLRDLATEALARFNIEVFPSSYDRNYDEGRTTQVPTGRVVGVKIRTSRKIGYNGRYINYEYVSD